MHVCVQLCCGYGKREKGNKYVVQMRRVEQILNKFFPEGFCEYSLFCKCSSSSWNRNSKDSFQRKGSKYP